MRSRHKIEFTNKKNIYVFSIIALVLLITWLIIHHISSSLYFSILMFIPFLINTIFLLIYMHQDKTRNKSLETMGKQNVEAMKTAIVILIGTFICVTVNISLYIGIITGINILMGLLIYKIKNSQNENQR